MKKRRKVGLTQEEKNWMMCQDQKAASLATMGREIDARPRPWGDTFEMGRKEREDKVAERKQEKKMHRQAVRQAKVEKVGRQAVLGLGYLATKISKPFEDLFSAMLRSTRSATEAMQKALFTLLNVPGLLKDQFYAIKFAVQEQWPETQYMLLNLIANGHLGGPGDGRARVSPERKAYLATLKPLPPLDPGPQFQQLFDHDHLPRRQVTNCVGFARLCGPDAGGADCCAQSGTCQETPKIEDTVRINLNICL